MSSAKELHLSFKASDDVKLPEVALLTKSISGLYNKLERLEARRQITDRRDRAKDLREERLVIKELRYGSNLEIILLTAANAGLLVPGFILATRQMKDRELERIAREKQNNKETAQMSFRRLVKGEEGDKLRKAISKYADELNIDVEKLLELVGPELEALYETKISFKPQDMPYK